MVRDIDGLEEATGFDFGRMEQLRLEDEGRPWLYYTVGVLVLLMFVGASVFLIRSSLSPQGRTESQAKWILAL